MPATCPYPEPARFSLYLTSHFPKIHLNIILPSKPRSPKWSISLSFPHQNPVYAYPLPHTCFMPSPSRSPRFYHPKSIWWAVQLIMQLPPLPCYLVTCRSKYSPQHSILIRSQPMFLPQYRRPSFAHIQHNREIIVMYILIFKFLDCTIAYCVLFTIYVYTRFSRGPR